MTSIKIKFFGLNDLANQIGNDEFNIDLNGDTFGDALKHLEKTFGSPFREAILNDEGEVDNTIQVVKNEDEWLSRDNFDYHLNEGDELFFFLMMAGG